LSGNHLNLVEASEKAAELVLHAHEMERIYQRAVRLIGEGELRLKVLDIATQAMRDKDLLDEVFSGDENKISFLCGVWIHVLLTDFAGVEKDKLQALAKTVFMSLQREKSFH
jgi:hypothetical protein